MKTLGQIAFESVNDDGYPNWDRQPESTRKYYEVMAQAVRAAVLEEAAMACEREKVEQVGDGDEAYNSAIDHCISALRALK